MTKPHDPSNAWRPVIAALANEDALAVFAQLVLGASVTSATGSLSAKKRDRAVQSLIAAGLLTGTPSEPTPVKPGAVFAEVLAQAPVRPRTGVERFLKDGRLDRYPMNLDERKEVLAWIAEHAVYPGEELNEAQVNERLKVFSRDYATLRRYLIDFELLERTRSGTSYALVSAEHNGA